MEDEYLEDVESFPPELLNERNKQITRTVRRLQAKKRVLQGNFDEQSERISVLGDHLKNVKNEIFHTQILINAKVKETDSENHMRMVAEREIHYILDELKNIEKRMADTMNRIDADKTEIFKGNEKLDNFKLEMNFNQEELEQWSLAEKQKEDDLIAIERYKRKDEQKISALTLQLEQLQKDDKRLKQALQHEITETQTSQIELNKTAEDFKKEHLERENLVKKYEETLKMMKKREEMIDEYEMMLSQIKSEMRERQEEIVKKQEELELQQVNNREVKGHIARIIRLNEKKKIAIEAKKREESSASEELITIRNRVSKTTTELHNSRSLKKQYKEDLKKLKIKLEKVEKTERSLKEELDGDSLKLATLEQKSKMVEKQLQNYVKREKKILDVINEMKEFLYKRQEELHKCKRREADLVAEISGSRAQSKNLQSKITQMDQEAYKQQELLYNIGYSIQQMERRVNRAQGQRTQEQTEKLKKTIDKLAGQLDATERKNGILNTEWKKAQGEVRKHNVLVKNQLNEKVKEGEIVNELIIQNDSHEKEIKRKSTEREDLMVQHDLLKLQIRRLNGLLRSKSQEVCGLENRKLQMELTYQEKEHRLDAVLKILKAELKATVGESRAIVLDRNERSNVVKRLKDKFAILLKRIKTDDEGEEITQAGFLINAIQEREELQRRGDQLDSQIQKLEREIMGLDKTLLTFRFHNVKFLRSQTRSSKSDGNYQRKQILEDEISRVESFVGEKIQEKTVHKESLEDVSLVHEQLLEQKDGLENEIMGYSEENQALGEEKMKLEMKLRNTLKIKRDYLKKVDAKKRPILKARELKTKTDQVLMMLAEISDSDKTLNAIFERLCTEKNVKYDPRPPSSRSTRSSHSRPGSRSSRPGSRPGSRPRTGGSKPLGGRSLPGSSRGLASSFKKGLKGKKKVSKSARTTPRSRKKPLSIGGSKLRKSKRSTSKD